MRGRRKEKKRRRRKKKGRRKEKKKSLLSALLLSASSLSFFAMMIPSIKDIIIEGTGRQLGSGDEQSFIIQMAHCTFSYTLIGPLPILISWKVIANAGLCLPIFLMFMLKTTSGSFVHSVYSHVPPRSVCT